MLQHIIDHKWTESKMYLILCGSSMSFMENQVLGKESPLYGRRTGQFKIEPLNYKETAVFHPNLSAEDNSLIYGITGGVPHYINKLNVRDSVDEALLDNFFDRSSYLYEEPGNLLKQELREPAVYNAIIKAIAEGASRMNDIKMKVGEENSVVAKYLKTTRFCHRPTTCCTRYGRYPTRRNNRSSRDTHQVRRLYQTRTTDSRQDASPRRHPYQGTLQL